MQTKVIILGSTGLLGTAFKHVSKSYNFKFLLPLRDELDLLNPLELEKYIKSHKPDFVINCAGQNDVKAIESDLEIFELALKLNSYLPFELSKLSMKYKFRLLTFSSDYVFDGQKKSYRESDIRNPINRYGLTKSFGEQLALSLDSKVSIFRTAWLFGPFRQNFVSFMVSKAIENEEIKVVDDQYGSPTFTIDIAEYILANIESHQNGVFHLVNDSCVSWYDLTKLSFMILSLPNKVQRVSSKDFKSSVNRPLNSCLNSYNIKKLRSLELALKDYLINYEL